MGGPIALVQDGDKIVINSVTRTINWLVDEEEQARRKAAWDASDNGKLNVRRGVLYRYARDVAVSKLQLRPAGILRVDPVTECVPCVPSLQASGPSATEA